MKMAKLMITGGAGFIGSAFVRRAVAAGFEMPVVVDKLTYAGDLRRLAAIKGKYAFYKLDILNEKAFRVLLRRIRPDIIVHFAAESHVDRSIRNPLSFIETNACGTHIVAISAKDFGVKKFIHISTDEVYGEISRGGFTEESPLRPNSPYSASKASADLIILSYLRTYSFPAVIIRPCNTYGPWQYPEKLIPFSVLNVLRNQKIPIYGRGKNIREWLYIDDCVEGILNVVHHGRVGSVYNLGSGTEKENIAVAHRILECMGKSSSKVRFIKDRPGHDLRYCLNSEKIRKEIGWSTTKDFRTGLAQTVSWCMRNKDWLFKKWNYVAKSYKRNICGF